MQAIDASFSVDYIGPDSNGGEWEAGGQVNGEYLAWTAQSPEDLLAAIARDLREASEHP